MSTLKEFTFSYSRLTSYEKCPWRYRETQISKTWIDSTEALDEGNEVHKALARTLMDGTPLPLKLRTYQKWIDLINETPGEMLVEGEGQWACTRDLQPTEFFNDKVWARCIVDVYKHAPDHPEGRIGYIVDWKTGKSRNVDPVQMTLMALMAFIHFPEIDIIKGIFIWLREGTSTGYLIRREDAPKHWVDIKQRVKRLEKATASDSFPPNPNHLCAKWCPVLSCTHNGRYPAGS